MAGQAGAQAIDQVDISGAAASADRLDTIGATNEGLSLGEADRLRFARQILFCLFLICLLVFGMYACLPENKGAAAVFDLVKIGVLPLVTLILGFYFPNSNNK